jgi:hypothetical protein
MGDEDSFCLMNKEGQKHPPTARAADWEFNDPKPASGFRVMVAASVSSASKRVSTGQAKDRERKRGKGPDERSTSTNNRPVPGIGTLADNVGCGSGKLEYEQREQLFFGQQSMGGGLAGDAGIKNGATEGGNGSLTNGDWNLTNTDCGITKPDTHDVLLGRRGGGGGTYNHMGNAKFRKLVLEHQMRDFARLKVEVQTRQVVALSSTLDPLARADDCIKRCPKRSDWEWYRPALSASLDSDDCLDAASRLGFWSTDDDHYQASTFSLSDGKLVSENGRCGPQTRRVTNDWLTRKCTDTHNVGSGDEDAFGAMPQNGQVGVSMMGPVDTSTAYMYPDIHSKSAERGGGVHVSDGERRVCRTVSVDLSHSRTRRRTY